MEHILDNDVLYRRVPFNNPNYIRDDQSITSFAFKPRKGEDGVSVNIARLSTYSESVFDTSRFLLYSIKAVEVRDQGLDCLHDPKENNYAHALITGKFTDGICKVLSLKAKKVVSPIDF
jgi:hypothetical protein